ncbi:MAG: DUF4149 domain-containing protein [Steroidobacter sp.]
MSARSATLLQFASSLLVTVWAGSLWTICLIAAPAAFATLPERRLAGLVVSRLFNVEAWLGVVVATLLVAVLAVRKYISKSTLAIILLTAALPLISQVVVVPLMDQARAANDMAQFGRLHGVSAMLFFTACLSAVALVWKVNRQAR